MSKINIFLLDDLNNIKEESNIIKPNSFKEFSNQIKKKFKSISDKYEIFFLDKNNNEIKINSETNCDKIQDILFIRQINKNISDKSKFDINYNILDKLHKDILDSKYSCMLCSNIIINYEPYLCYKCQKIFHEKCLKDLDKKCKSQNKNLLCPNCNYKLPIENWNKKLFYEENRKDYINLINELNGYKLKNNMNKNLNMIKDKKINELKENNIKLNKFVKKCEKYMNKTFEVIKNILNKLNLTHSLLTIKNNQKLDELLKISQFNLDNINIDNTSNVINEEFEQLINNIKNKSKKETSITLKKNTKTKKYNSIPHKKLNIDFSSSKKTPVKNSSKEPKENQTNKNSIPSTLQQNKEVQKESEQQNENAQEIDEEELNIEALFRTEDGRIIFRNGLLRGIIHKYAEIDDVISKIQDILLKGAKFNLVYKAFEHGDTAEIFHQKCDKLDMSLVLVETDKDLRFGGFTMQSWEGNNIQKIDNNAFVFNLETNSIYDIIKNEPAIGCYPKFGPVFFGCQIRIFDKFFCNGGSTCMKGLNYKTKKNYELNNGKPKYLVKDIEVYGIEAIDV